MAPLGSKSLYEFIYIDDYRLKSLIAQINNEGILLEYQTGLTMSSSTSGSKKNTKSGELGGSAVLAKTSGTKEVMDGNSETEQEGKNLKYDATYASPVQLFELVEANELAYKSLNAAKYGGLLHIKGSLKLIDTSHFKLATKPFNPVLNMIEKMGESGNPYGFDMSGLEVFTGGDNSIVKSMFSIFEDFPQTINMTMLGKTGKAWSTLNPESLRINIWDYVLKCGNELPGEWHCLALLDSRPNHIVSTNASQGSNDSQRLDSMVTNVLSSMRGFLGIEDDTYGVTPILIFREVNPKKNK